MKPIKEIESQYNWARRSNKYKQACFSSMSELYKISKQNPINSSNVELSPNINTEVPCKK